MIIPVLVVAVSGYSQHLETTIKVVEGKARIAVKAAGGDVIGYPSNYVMVVAIPKVSADAEAALSTPIKLDAARTSEHSVTTLPVLSDATNKYFLLFYTGASSNTSLPAVFKAGEEYDILELTWDGPIQSFQVSLVSLPDGNPRSSVAPSQWQH